MKIILPLMEFKKDYSQKALIRYQASLQHYPWTGRTTPSLDWLSVFSMWRLFEGGVCWTITFLKLLTPFTLNIYYVKTKHV